MDTFIEAGPSKTFEQSMIAKILPRTSVILNVEDEQKVLNNTRGGVEEILSNKNAKYNRGSRGIGRDDSQRSSLL